MRKMDSDGYSRTNYGSLAVDSLSEMGRCLMMDLGLSGLVDRLEKEFGPKAVRYLLALIAFTVIILCLRIVVTAVWPAAEWVTNTAGGASLDSVTRHAVTLVANVALIAAILATVANVIDSRRVLRRAETSLFKADEAIEQTSNLLETTVSAAYATGAECLKALEAAEAIARANNAVVELDQIAEHRRKIEAFLEQVTHPDMASERAKRPLT